MDKRGGAIGRYYLRHFAHKQRAAADIINMPTTANLTPVAVMHAEYRQYIVQISSRHLPLHVKKIGRENGPVRAQMGRKWKTFIGVLFTRE